MQLLQYTYTRCVQSTEDGRVQTGREEGGAQPGYLLLREMDRPKMVMDPSMREVISIKLCLLGSPSISQQNKTNVIR